MNLHFFYSSIHFGTVIPVFSLFFSLIFPSDQGLCLSQMRNGCEKTAPCQQDRGTPKGQVDKAVC